MLAFLQCPPRLAGGALRALNASARAPLERTVLCSHRLIVLALVGAMWGCGPAEANRNGDGGTSPADSGTGHPEPPETPFLTMTVPPRTPYPVITIRGAAAGAERVILMQSGGNPIAQSVGGDGAFCFDMPADEPGDYSFSLEAHANGLVSEGRTIVMATMDPAAPPIEDLRTCDGASPEGCRSRVEDCSRIGDEDCNGRADAADPVCSNCSPDYLEPNDTAATVPGYEPNTYDDLTLCADEVDYYGVNLSAGDAVNVRIFFSDSEGNLDLELLPPGGGMPLISSTTTTDDESIFYRATTSGKHLIRVFGRSALDTASYSLRISVTT